MTSRRIFISHTTRDPEADGLLRSLQAHLAAADFEPIVSDERMRLGNDWGYELQRDLGRCDGAVIIVSPHALGKGTWVYDESNILMHRRSNNPRFTVIPVLCGVTLEKFTRSPLDNRMHLSRLHMPDSALADPAPAIVTQLLADFPPERPLHILESKVRQELRQVSEELLDKMGKILGENIEGQNKEQKLTAISGRLFATDRDKFVAALELICDLRNAGDISRVIEFSFPFSWIKSAAVEPLRRRSSDTGSYALNSTCRLTGRMYVQCASTGPETYVADAVEKSREDVVSATLSEVQIALAGAFAYRLDKLPEPSTLRIKIADRAARGTPVVILLRPPVDPEVVVAIAEQYPELISLVMAGHPVPDGLPPDVLVLQPHLDPAVEADSHAEYELLMRNAGYEILENGTKRRSPA